MTEIVTPSRGLARIGVVVPVSNTNLEPDMAMLAPAGVSIHVARSGGYDVESIPDENQMRQYSNSATDEPVESLRLCRADVILYGCTSATLAQGPEYDARFREHIEKVTGIPAITAASALTDAIIDLNISRFAFTSPYVRTLNDLAVSFIESCGMRCVGRVDTPDPFSNLDIANASPASIIAMAEKANTPDAEVIVISCTDFRAVEAVQEIERRIKKPVVTSNQAMMVWALKRLRLDCSTSLLGQHLVSSCAKKAAASV